MPVVQYESDLSKTTEISHFLSDCRQQAMQTGEAKIASLSFSMAAVSPWEALSALDGSDRRHFYYDRPKQAAIVGIESVVACCGVGSARFEQAQAFVRLWRSRVTAHFFNTPSSASRTGKPAIPPKLHFFCSSTFFEQTTTDFEPIYVFVPQVQVTTYANASTITFNSLMTADTVVEQVVSQISKQLELLQSGRSINEDSSIPQRRVVSDVNEFDQSVSAVLKKIGRDGLHKVVLADVMDVVADQPFDSGRSLQTLRQNHPDCTVFSVGNGRGQSFIGASPERLLSIQENKITTDALAGSAPRGVTLEIDTQLAQTLLNSEKERYEHRVVVEFLLAQLRSLNLIPEHTTDPQLMRLFHIQHLHTPISATLTTQRVSPLEVLSRLHPTPAVAGVPRQQACQLIRQHEPFDRGPYAAPLGWIDTEGNSEFIVGIRSALIDGCNARLYAGAGIVPGSQPAKELAEIKLKLQSLLNALR